MMEASRGTINLGRKMQSGILEPYIGCDLKGKKLTIIGLGPSLIKKIMKNSKLFILKQLIIVNLVLLIMTNCSRQQKK
jgi:hypothetical protein